MTKRRPKVLLHSDQAEEAQEVLTRAHPDLELAVCDTYEGLPSALDRHQPEVVYSVRFAGTPSFPRTALLGCPSLKWISVGGSGTDHLQPWDGQRLTVTNAAGVAAQMMAEYVLGTMLSFTLRLRDFARDQANRRWRAAEVVPLAGKTVLILGLGQTGRAVAALSKAVGLTVLGVRANPQATPGVDEVHATDQLARLWRRADFIVVCLPLLAATRGLVGAGAFASTKPSAVLIDVSRGGVVVEAALIEALDRGRLAGAALDVFEIEPLPADSPLWGRQEVLITPHCSSVYVGWTRRSVELFAENLARYRRGSSLHNVVLPERGY